MSRALDEWLRKSLTEEAEATERQKQEAIQLAETAKERDRAEVEAFGDLVRDALKPKQSLEGDEEA